MTKTFNEINRKIKILCSTDKIHSLWIEKCSLKILRSVKNSVGKTECNIEQFFIKISLFLNALRCGCVLRFISYLDPCSLNKKKGFSSCRVIFTGFVSWINNIYLNFLDKSVPDWIIFKIFGESKKNCFLIQ